MFDRYLMVLTSWLIQSSYKRVCDKCAYDDYNRKVIQKLTFGDENKVNDRNFYVIYALTYLERQINISDQNTSLLIQVKFDPSFCSTISDLIHDPISAYPKLIENTSCANYWSHC